MQKPLLFLLVCVFRFLPLQGQTVTYATVQPIFVNKCGPCHRPGDAGPFPLGTYADVSKRLSFIRDVIARDYMPPWKADPHYREFANTRALAPAEKSLLIRWIDAGGPQGNQKHQKSEKVGSINEQAILKKEELLKVTAYSRKPDLTLKLDSAFTVVGDNVERFIDFKIPFEFKDEKNVEAIEFVTNNKRIIHHINYGFYEVADSSIQIFGGKNLIDPTDLNGTDPNLFTPLKKKMIYYTGWIPGASVENYPKGFGWGLPRRGVMILTAHYMATAVDERSIVGVNLFFRKDSIRRHIRIISLGSGGIAENDISPPLIIPPNQLSTYHLKVRTQEEQSLLYVWPHMHLLGKEFYAYAVTPDNDTIPLVHIPDWDFKWQELYKFRSLIRIPKGSVINLDCTYDNTANNPSNPNNPPKRIFSFGDMSATNEMMTLLLIYVPYREGDEKVSLQE
jgi:Copper type II ascorbate-dependent monooxygenase, C-terminal domain